MTNHPLTINHEEKFSHLPDAPIVEAVIQWRVEPGRDLDQEESLRILEEKFREYKVRPQHRMSAEFHTSGEIHSEGFWDGFRLTNNEDHHVCQFLKKSIILSRLKPYDTWERLLEEALKFWEAYQKLVQPISIEGMSTRFINRIELSEEEDISNIVIEDVSPLKEMGIMSKKFFRVDEISFPGYPYNAKLTRALEIGKDDRSRSLVVDIDVSTDCAMDLDDETLQNKMNDLRYLKNKIFFSYLVSPDKRYGSS